MIRLSPADPTFLGPVLERSLQRVKDKTRDRWTVPFLLGRIQTGQAGLFRFHDDGEHMAFMVVERYDQGEAPWMNVWILEGDGLDRFDECLPLVDLLARQIGATAWRCTGRRGWAKWLKPIATVYERELI